MANAPVEVVRSCTSQQKHADEEFRLSFLLSKISVPLTHNELLLTKQNRGAPRWSTPWPRHTEGHTSYVHCTTKNNVIPKILTPSKKTRDVAKNVLRTPLVYSMPFNTMYATTVYRCTSVVACQHTRKHTRKNAGVRAEKATTAFSSTSSTVSSEQFRRAQHSASLEGPRWGSHTRW